MKVRSFWLVCLTVATALMVATWFYRPRASLIIEPPRDPVTRARCLTLLEKTRPGLSGVGIHPVTDTDLIEITAGGFTRREARTRIDTATAFLDELARQAHEGRVDEKIEATKKASKGITPAQQYAELSKINLSDSFYSQGEWLVRERSESGFDWPFNGVVSIP